LPDDGSERRRGKATRVQPLDVWKCHGCGQVLRFDDRGHVPMEQVDACRSRCDWELKERRGRQIVDLPGL
jgi:hypothetical protein